MLLLSPCITCIAIFVRIYKSTSAMADGDVNRLWEIEDIVGLLPEPEAKRKKAALIVPNMRNIIYELRFIHEILQRGGPVAALGGILVLAVGFLLGRLEMMLAGAFVTLVVLADYVVMWLFGSRNSN